MKANMGTVDKSIRLFAAIIIGALYFAGVISGILAIVLLIIAGVFIITIFVGTCPLYLPLGLSTLRRKKHGSE
jgi:K+-transporting ATPase A subunit